MLLDSIPQRIKEDPDFVKILNHNFTGDVKSQNVPGIQTLLDMCKNKDKNIAESR